MNKSIAGIKYKKIENAIRKSIEYINEDLESELNTNRKRFNMSDRMYKKFILSDNRQDNASIGKYIGIRMERYLYMLLDKNKKKYNIWSGSGYDIQTVFGKIEIKTRCLVNSDIFRDFTGSIHSTKNTDFWLLIAVKFDPKLNKITNFTYIVMDDSKIQKTKDIWINRKKNNNSDNNSFIKLNFLIENDDDLLIFNGEKLHKKKYIHFKICGEI